MRKYEMIMLLAMFVWFGAQNMENRKFTELKKCKVCFLAFAIAGLAIILSPNVPLRIPELGVFFGITWYGLRVFTKDIITFVKAILQNIFIKENADE